MAYNNRHVPESMRKPEAETVADVAMRDLKSFDFAPPLWLKEGYAQDEWNRIIPILFDQGCVAEADLTIIATYCETYSLYQEAAERVRLDGPIIEKKNGPAQHPALLAMRALQAVMMGFSSMYGFNPRSRAKIKVPKKKKSELDEFDSFIDEGKHNGP